jgi:hypothetical protein
LINTALIIEIAAGLLTIIGTIAANFIQNSRRDEIQDERLKHIEQMVLEKIDNLRTKVEKHNELVERMYKAEGAIVENAMRIKAIEKQSPNRKEA